MAVVRRPLVSVSALVLAALVAGCANGPRTTGSTGTTGPARAETTTDLASASRAWSEAYQRNPNDRATVVGYVTALRANRQTGEAVAVLSRARLQFPDDFEIASAYGKALADNGDFSEALKVVRSVNPDTSPDWRLISAEAAINDQTGNHAEARRLYERALKIAPGEPNVLSNYGMSYLLTGELPLAEGKLRQAAASPRASARIRQNLAAVLVMRGAAEEAQQILSRDLPPDQVAAKIAEIRAAAPQPAPTRTGTAPAPGTPRG